MKAARRPDCTAGRRAVCCDRLFEGDRRERRVKHPVLVFFLFLFLVLVVVGAVEGCAVNGVLFLVVFLFVVVRARHRRICENAFFESALLAADDRAGAGRIHVGRDIAVDRHHVGAALMLMVAHVVPAEILELLLADLRLVNDERRDLRTHRGLCTAFAGQQRRAERGETGFGHGA